MQEIIVAQIKSKTYLLLPLRKFIISIKISSPQLATSRPIVRNKLFISHILTLESVLLIHLDSYNQTQPTMLKPKEKRSFQYCKSTEQAPNLKTMPNLLYTLLPILSTTINNIILQKNTKLSSLISKQSNFSFNP